MIPQSLSTLLPQQTPLKHLGFSFDLFDWKLRQLRETGIQINSICNYKISNKISNTFFQIEFHSLHLIWTTFNSILSPKKKVVVPDRVRAEHINNRVIGIFINRGDGISCFYHWLDFTAILRLWHAGEMSGSIKVRLFLDIFKFYAGARCTLCILKNNLGISILGDYVWQIRNKLSW